MFNKNEHLTAEAQKAIDTAMDLVTTSIQGVEKLTHIQLETSRQILEETSQAIKELAGVGDAKEMFNRINSIATHAVEKNLSSARDVYDVVSEVQTKINKVAEESVQTMQQAAINSVEGLAQYHPAGAQAATSSLKTWINSANQAMATLNKVAAQVTEFANSNLNVATASTASAAKKANKK